MVADRGYFSGEQILACEEDAITVTLPKPQTSGNRAKGQFVTWRSGKSSSRRSTWMYSRLPRGPKRASRRRRSVSKAGSSFHPRSGAAWSWAPGFLSSSDR